MAERERSRCYYRFKTLVTSHHKPQEVTFASLMTSLHCLSFVDHKIVCVMELQQCIAFWGPGSLLYTCILPRALCPEKNLTDATGVLYVLRHSDAIKSLPSPFLFIGLYFSCSTTNQYDFDNKNIWDTILHVCKFAMYAISTWGLWIPLMRC